SVTGEGKKLSSPSKMYFDPVIKRRDVRKDKVALQLREVLESDILQDRINKAHAYLTRLVASSPNPPIFINGATISRNDEWLQAMSNRVTLDLRAIQQGVFNGSFGDDTYLPSHFLARASHRRNALVIPEDEKNIKVFDLASMYIAHERAINGLPLLPADASSEKEEWASFVVIADFDTDQGFNLLAELARFRHEHGGVEMAFVHNPANVKTGSTTSDHLVHALKEGTVEALEHLIHDPKASFGNQVSAEDVKESREIWTSARPFVDSLGLNGGQAALVLNGRLVGPISSSEAFAKDDLETLL
ncbi:killer toxin resistant protein, partial [Cryomyces antarcticus]